MLPLNPWPLDILTPAHPGFRLAGGVRVGTPSMSGLQEIDSTDGGQFWRARMIDIPLHCDQQILTAQAIQGVARGGAGLFNVPRYLLTRALPNTGSVGVPHSDGSSFSDMSRYSSPLPQAQVTDSWLMTSSFLKIGMSADAEILGGEEFSIFYSEAGYRLYRIIALVGQEGHTFEVEITPPLREDTPHGTLVEFAQPLCTMRMTNAESFLDVLEYARWADVTAEFEEAFW